MMFEQRSPSTQWEPIPLVPGGPFSLWGWFKPAHAPASVALRTPPELWRNPDIVPHLTVRQLAEATGIDWLHSWMVYGQPYVVDERTEPLLDMPIPTPPAGIDPLVVLWTHPVPAAVASPVVGSVLPAASIASGVLPAGVDPTPMFEQIEYYWTAVLQIESDVRRARMQLEQAVGKLASLNRDLNTEEALAADTLDKKEWQDTRRWLRDCMGGLSRSIKEIDVGTLSGAGQRHRFEDLIKNFVQPRIPFPGLPQAVIDFEMHHKTAKNVLTAAQTALNKGSTDGERRANMVLQRIAGKVRQRRSKARGT